MASTPAQGKTNAPAGVSGKSASFVTRKINGLAKPVSGIIGPASVIQVELIDGRQWDEAVSKGGVVGYVSHIAKPALRERGTNRKTGGARPRKVELHRAAYKLALEQIPPDQMRERPDISLRVHASIRRQLKAEAIDARTIAFTALKDVLVPNTP